MKSILLLTENLGSGGAERQLVGLAYMLKKHGYEVTVITYYKNQFYEPFLREHEVEYFFVPKLRNKVFRAFRLIKIIKNYKIDTVIAFLPSANKAACVARFFRQFKLIISERSHTNSINWKTNLQFFLYRKASWLVANSYSEAANICEHFPKLKDKTIAIPNYVDCVKFCPPAKKREKEVPLLLTVGRIIPEKNVLNYLDALAKLKDSGLKFKAKWVGSMYHADYVKEVKGKIEELNIKDIFTIQGQTENVVSEYQQADLFCLPSFYEGYPNVIVEAMSCGLPIACSKVCENPRIIKEGQNGFMFDPYNISEMSDALKRTLNLSARERIAIGQSNRNSVMQNNSGERFVEQYINLIETTTLQ